MFLLKLEGAGHLLCWHSDVQQNADVNKCTARSVIVLFLVSVSLLYLMTEINSVSLL